MILNLIMILLFSVALIVGIIVFLRSHQAEKAMTPQTYEELKDYVRGEIDKASTMMVANLGLSLENREKQLRQREDLRNYIRNACSGDRGARKAVNQLVRDKLANVVNESNLDNFISFSPDDASAVTMFESLLYINDTNIQKKLENRTSTDIFGLADDGYWNLSESIHINRSFEFDTLKSVYSSQYLMLDYDDKIEILTQILFSELYGLGVIDSLNYQTRGIEEVQIGMRGPQTRAFDYQRIIVHKESSGVCAKDKVYVIFRGMLTCLEFLGFKTDAEMQRVINNLVINCNAGELTEKNPKIVADSIDGRRITASRPPLTDAWLALIRKFNLADIILKNLYSAELLTDTLTWLVKSGGHIAVTGEMETGKTTLLRALLAITDPKYSIRIVENDSFELNGREYFPERNVTSMKVSREFDEEDVLAFARRTTGQIFSVGEVNELSMANLANKLSKIATQILFSAHYTSTASMISDFKNAKIANGFTNVRLAEIEAIEGLDFDVHVENRDGVRYIEYINEIILTDDKYQIKRILTGTKDGKITISARPSEEADEKAKKYLTAEDYAEYIRFWEEQTKTETPKWLEETMKAPEQTTKAYSEALKRSAEQE